MAQAPRGAQPIEPVLVVIPTYNERENLGPILTRLHEALPEVHALVVDDGSPDGTGELADELAEKDDRVRVMHRTEKAGLGAAYVAGFGWGLERDYNTIVEMDADGSHAPEDLPRVLEALGDADLVLGSRYVPGGSVVNWPFRRQLLSKLANVYAGICLGQRASRTSPPGTARTAARCCRSCRWTTSPRPGTASRSTWPGAPPRRASR